MEPVKYHISDATRDELSQALSALNIVLPPHKNGEPMPTLSSKERLAIRTTLMRVLNFDPQGSQALSAMEEIRALDASPFVVVQNLPTEKEVRWLVVEGFRQYLYNESSIQTPNTMQREEIKDRPRTLSSAWLPRFAKGGNRQLHFDSADVSCNFMVEPGDGLRPTVVFSPEDFVQYVTEKCKLGYETLSDEKKSALYDDVKTLLRMPIWHYAELSRTDAPERIVYEDGGKPILYKNASAKALPEGISPLCFAPINVGMEGALRLVSTKNAVPEELQDLATSIEFTMQVLTSKPRGINEGYLAEKGDVVMYDNQRVIHAGGHFVEQEKHSRLETARRVIAPISRHMISADTDAPIPDGVTSHEAQKPLNQLVEIAGAQAERMQPKTQKRDV